MRIRVLTLFSAVFLAGSCIGVIPPTERRRDDGLTKEGIPQRQSDGRTKEETIDTRPEKTVSKQAGLEYEPAPTKPQDGGGRRQPIQPQEQPQSQDQQSQVQPQYQQREQSQYQPGHISSEPTDAPQTSAPVQAGKFVLLYLGLNFPLKTSSAQSSYITAPRLGGLLGFYVGSHVSINGEFSLDVLNPSGAGTTDEALLGFSFSPLIHFGSPRVEFAVGPRLGYFWHPGSDLSNTDFTESGLLYGLNMGAFFLPFRGLSFGGLVSLTAHSTQNVCQNDVCGKGTGHTPFVLAFTAAVLVPRLCIRRGGQCL
jgi:hypothetical protein